MDWLGLGKIVGKPNLDVKPVTPVGQEGGQGAEDTQVIVGLCIK